MVSERIRPKTACLEAVYKFAIGTACHDAKVWVRALRWSK
jgi:hypothetical protein